MTETFQPIPEDFFSSIIGRTIGGGDLGEDGMHIFLNDGRIIVITGAFIAGVVMVNKEALQ